MVESEISQLNLDAKMEKLAWEARARLTWGDNRHDVKAWLLQAGADEYTAQLVIETCLRERARSLRLKGMRDLLIATGLIGAAGGIWFGAIPALIDLLGGLPVKPVLFVGAGCSFAGLYGAHRAWRGTARLLLGARTKGADSDVNELW